jgi:hypothetical protein
VHSSTVRLHKFGTRVGGTEHRYKALDAVAASAAAAARTIELTVRGQARLVLKVDFTRSAGTAVVLTPTYSLDDGTTYASITSTTISSGAGALDVYTDTRTTSSSGIFGVAYDVRGYDKFKVLFAVTGGGAGDLLTVYATGAVGL